MEDRPLPSRRRPSSPSSPATQSPGAAGALLVTVAGPAALAGLLALAGPAPVAGQAVDADRLGAMEAREIGPAAMSGRIAAIAGVPGRPDTAYVGAATGGVWKTVNGGTTWEPIFDDQPASSIGAIAVHPRSPDVVWVGTGEDNMRNSAGVGRGVWKSMDGGHTWEKVGLEDSEHIAEIVVHPDDPDVVWVAALGPMWNDGDQRGVYRTTDGGESWERVLEGANDRTGASDLVMDPENPNKLFAGLWQFRRWPHFFDSGGPGSGLWVSHDGGDTWEEITPTDALPQPPYGKVNVAVAPSDPGVVYALFEAKNTTLVRSDDGGRSWESVNRSSGMGDRPFYYNRLVVDPERPGRVYHVAGNLRVSTDAGRTFETLAGWGDGVHVDHHALWVSRTDPNTIYDGNDGGVYISRDRGETWRLVENLPLAQFYEIDVDVREDGTPYHVYGGLQDNGSWRGPAEVWEQGGIRNYHWTEIGFGDGFGAVDDPNDPRYGWVMSQGGNLQRYDLETGNRRAARPDPPADSVELRFNWNSPIEASPHDPDVVFYGSQYVHRSPDDGLSWETISRDLTTDDPEWQRQAQSGGLTKDVTQAENYTTVYALDQSPVDPDVIWAGTDDGNVQVTRDGGETWTNVQGNMPGKPRNGWVSHVHASVHDAGTAFVAVHDYMHGDWTNYLYRTRDHGESWTRLGTDGVDGFARTVLQDPEVPRLLYQGTEFGLFVSVDGGRSWEKWTHGVPTVPVRALAVQPVEHDLVAGTHGRGVYVLDDLRPLRAVARDPGVMDETLHLFEVGTAVQHETAAPKVFRFDGSAKYSGENEPYGAMITLAASVPEPGAGVGDEGGDEGDGDAGQADDGEAGAGPARATVEVLRADSVIRTFREELSDGLNRFTWGLRMDGFDRPGQEEAGPFGPPAGPEVLPGEYTLRVVALEDTVTGSVEVRPDPRSDVPMADRQAKLAALMEAGQTIEEVTAAVERVRDAGASVANVLDALERHDVESADSIRTSADELKRALYRVEKRLVGPPGDSVQGITADSSAMSRINGAYFSLSSSWDAPTEAQETYLRIAQQHVREAVEATDRVFREEVADFRELVRESELSFMPEEQPEETGGDGGSDAPAAAAGTTAGGGAGAGSGGGRGGGSGSG